MQLSSLTVGVATEKMTLLHFKNGISCTESSSLIASSVFCF